VPSLKIVVVSKGFQKSNFLGELLARLSGSSITCWQKFEEFDWMEDISKNRIDEKYVKFKS